jgi:hypothetical protein
MQRRVHYSGFKHLAITQRDGGITCTGRVASDCSRYSTVAEAKPNGVRYATYAVHEGSTQDHTDLPHAVIILECNSHRSITGMYSRGLSYCPPF